MTTLFESLARQALDFPPEITPLAQRSATAEGHALGFDLASGENDRSWRELHPTVSARPQANGSLQIEIDPDSWTEPNAFTAMPDEPTHAEKIVQQERVTVGRSRDPKPDDDGAQHAQIDSTGIEDDAASDLVLSQRESGWKARREADWEHSFEKHAATTSSFDSDADLAPGATKLKASGVTNATVRENGATARLGSSTSGAGDPLFAAHDLPSTGTVPELPRGRIQRTVSESPHESGPAAVPNAKTWSRGKRTSSGLAMRDVLPDGTQGETSVHPPSSGHAAQTVDPPARASLGSLGEDHARALASEEHLSGSVQELTDPRTLRPAASWRESATEDKDHTRALAGGEDLSGSLRDVADPHRSRLAASRLPVAAGEDHVRAPDGSDSVPVSFSGVAARKSTRVPKNDAQGRAVNPTAPARTTRGPFTSFVTCETAAALARERVPGDTLSAALDSGTARSEPAVPPSKAKGADGKLRAASTGALSHPPLASASVHADATSGQSFFEAALRQTSEQFAPARSGATRGPGSLREQTRVNASSEKARRPTEALPSRAGAPSPVSAVPSPAPVNDSITDEPAPRPRSRGGIPPGATTRLSSPSAGWGEALHDPSATVERFLRSDASRARTAIRPEHGVVTSVEAETAFSTADKDGRAHDPSSHVRGLRHNPAGPHTTLQEHGREQRPTPATRVYSKLGKNAAKPAERAFGKGEPLRAAAGTHVKRQARLRKDSNEQVLQNVASSAQELPATALSSGSPTLSPTADAGTGLRNSSFAFAGQQVGWQSEAAPEVSSSSPSRLRSVVLHGKEGGAGELVLRSAGKVPQGNSPVGEARTAKDAAAGPVHQEKYWSSDAQTAGAVIPVLGISERTGSAPDVDPLPENGPEMSVSAPGAAAEEHRQETGSTPMPVRDGRPHLILDAPLPDLRDHVKRGVPPSRLSPEDSRRASDRANAGKPAAGLENDFAEIIRAVAAERSSAPEPFSPEQEWMKERSPLLYGTVPVPQAGASALRVYTAAEARHALTGSASSPQHMSPRASARAASDDPSQKRADGFTSATPHFGVRPLGTPEALREGLAAEQSAAPTGFGRVPSFVPDGAVLQRVAEERAGEPFQAPNRSSEEGQVSSKQMRERARQRSRLHAGAPAATATRVAAVEEVSASSLAPLPQPVAGSALLAKGQAIVGVPRYVPNSTGKKNVPDRQPGERALSMRQASAPLVQVLARGGSRETFVTDQATTAEAVLEITRPQPRRSQATTALAASALTSPVSTRDRASLAEPAQHRATEDAPAVTQAAAPASGRASQNSSAHGVAAEAERALDGTQPPTLAPAVWAMRRAKPMSRSASGDIADARPSTPSVALAAAHVATGTAPAISASDTVQPVSAPSSLQPMPAFAQRSGESKSPGTHDTPSHSPLLRPVPVVPSVPGTLPIPRRQGNALPRVSQPAPLRVDIGRISIAAASSASRTARSGPRARPGPMLTLTEYLRRRTRRTNG